MKTFYIKGLKKRYSIREDGNIVSHYKILNNSKRLYKDRILSKHFNTAKITKHYSPVVNLYFEGSKRAKTIFVNTLMIEYFKLTPPDNHHQYKLYYKDGNNRNNSLDNLEWEILTVREYEFKPHCYYDNKGLIISKVCGVCGENRDIVNFTFSNNPTHKGSKSTKYSYRNTCEICRSQEQLESIYSNEERFLKLKSRSEQWAKSEKGREYYKKYRKYYGLKITKELSDCYVRQNGVKKGISMDIMDDSVVEILRTQLQIKRETNNQR